VNWKRSWLILVLAGVAAATTTVSASEPVASVTAKLIYGSNTDQPKEQALADLEPRFKPDFGYKHYRLLGEKSVTLKEGYSETLDLGHQFAVSVKHKETRKQFHVLAIDLYHKEKWLLFLEVSVKNKSEPIFIKGPNTEQGLVIIALTAK
jgi:hypothetical protein